MTYFVKQGSIFRSTDEENIKISKSLPVGTYSVGADMQGFYFEPMDDLTVEGKIYGDTTRKVERVMNTFNDRPNTTGIILQGEKGSGKTMFARLLSSKLLEQGVVTLVVNSPYAGEPFNTLINSIEQPCVVVFDEFEKVYSSDNQQKLLTLLDGTGNSKKLYVVTCNDIYRVSEYMKNRPGRFFYSFSYNGLSPEFVREYCEDALDNKSRIESVVTFSGTFSKLNFDILKAIVEEMNRYDEPVSKAIEYLNATPMDQRFKLELVGLQCVDKTVNVTRHEEMANYGGMVNPFTDTVHFTAWTSKSISSNSQEVFEEDYEDIFDENPVKTLFDENPVKTLEAISKGNREYSIQIRFRPENLVKMENGMYFFANDKFASIFKRKEEQQIDITRLMAI